MHDPAENPAISLCVINYDGAAVLEATLAALGADGWPFAERLLIDNGSRDASREIGRRLCPDLRIIPLGANHGPAYARNVGFRAATGTRVLFVDNDVHLTPGCTAALSAALDDDPQAVAAMPMVLEADNPGRIQFDGAGAHFLGLMSLHNAGRPADLVDPDTRRIDSVVTACLLIDRARWGSEPPFCEAFFIYLEDHEFGLRCRVLGHALLAVPAARVLHGAGTAGLALRTTGIYARVRVLDLMHNRWALMVMNYHWRTLGLLAPVLLLYEAAQFAIAVKKRWLGYWLEAVCWTARLAPEFLRRRRGIQARRRTPDREILSGGPLPFVAQLTGSRAERSAKRLLDRVTMAYWRAIRRWI